MWLKGQKPPSALSQSRHCQNEVDCRHPDSGLAAAQNAVGAENLVRKLPFQIFRMTLLHLGAAVATVSEPDRATAAQIMKADGHTMVSAMPNSISTPT